MIMRTFLILLMCCGLLAACSSTPIKLYPGAEKPASKIATLKIPVEIEILTLNGKKISASHTLLGTGDQQLQLLPGSYDLLVYYKNIWKTGADSHKTVRSQPVTFHLKLAAGHSYQMAFHKPTNTQKSENFIQQFSPWVVDEKTGNRTNSQTANVKFSDSFFSQLVGATALVKTGKQDAAGNQIIAPLNSAPVQPTTSTASKPTKPSQSSYLDMLKAQWNLASKAEKRAFLQWIGGQ